MTAIEHPYPALSQAWLHTLVDLIASDARGGPGLTADEAKAEIDAAIAALPAPVSEVELTALRGVAAAARAELYAFKLAFAGGEDAPGSAGRVTVEDVQRWMADAARESSDLCRKIDALKTERDALWLDAALGDAS